MKSPAWVATVYDRHGEKLRFLVVGFWNTLFSTGVLWLLDRYIPYDAHSLVQKEAVLLLNWAIAVTQNFFSFKLLVFRTRGNWLKEYGRMYVTYGATFVVQSALILALSTWLGWSIFWSSIPTLFLVTIMSYFGHKYFTFRGRHLIEAIDAGEAFDAPAPESDTMSAEYAERLVRLQTAWWKRLLPVQAPYRYNLRRLEPGFTLDVGCGIGRNLSHLDGDGVGIDHNPQSVGVALARGLSAYTPEGFATSEHARAGAFDSLLCAHVAEHMDEAGFVALLSDYLPFVKTGGKLIVITPQEVGSRSDASHVAFVDFDAIGIAAAAVGVDLTRAYSFPFPRPMGRLFVYNEFVWVGRVRR